MYSILKKLAKNVLPETYLYEHERFLRSIFAFSYRGKKHHCKICDHKLSKFINLNERDLLCPFCGSRARTRRLYANLINDSLLSGKILHFSPSRGLYKELKKNTDIEYFSTDFENEFIAEYRFDITQIDCEDNAFDLIICYHILEHILEDQKAMQELHRVLKPNGVCLIQTPFKNGFDIYEDATITSKEDRLKAFGQEDHVRIYSIEGLVARLKSNHFSQVTAAKFETDMYSGFKEETIIIVKK